ncbi:MAG TPA: PsiF family protein [Stellaceae bacterium]|nr:PsiF family protein [Stellaceae bacterium]
MLRVVLAGCLGAAIAVVPALAQQPRAPTPAQAAQQERMKSCNADASRRNFNGAARQSFMRACLAGKMTPTTLMRVCNAQAAQDKLRSDARKTYVGSCLRKSG